MNTKLALKAYVILFFLSFLVSCFFYAFGVRFGADAFEEIGFHFILLFLGGLIFGTSQTYLLYRSRRRSQNYSMYGGPHHDHGHVDGFAFHRRALSPKRVPPALTDPVKKVETK